MGHKTFALGTDALPLNNFFTGIAGAHERPPFSYHDRQNPWETRAFSSHEKCPPTFPGIQGHPGQGVLPSGNIFNKIS
jgi:hypothetical protein